MRSIQDNFLVECLYGKIFSRIDLQTSYYCIMNDERLDIIQNIDIRKKLFLMERCGLGRTFLKFRNIVKIATTKKKSQKISKFSLKIYSR